MGIYCGACKNTRVVLGPDGNRRSCTACDRRTAGVTAATVTTSTVTVTYCRVVEVRYNR